MAARLLLSATANAVNAAIFQRSRLRRSPIAHDPVETPNIHIGNVQ
jgi:hypothetical protein